MVVEGYFDRIALQRAGIEEALATCGTALSEDHARALRRRARQVVLLFDGDAAGRRAALRALESLLPSGLRVRAGALPPGDDPDTLLAREGAEALRAVVEQAPAGLDLAIADAVAGGCATPEQKADAVAAVVPLVARIPDATERTAWAQRLALAAGAREADVETSVRAAARSGDGVAEAPSAPAPRLLPGEERHLGQLLQALLDHPASADAEDLAAIALAAADPSWRELLATLAEGCRTRPAAGLLPWLEARLAPETLAKLHGAISEAPRCETEEAARAVVGGVAARFAKRLERERQRAITQRIRVSPPDEAVHLLPEKSRIEAR